MKQRKSNRNRSYEMKEKKAKRGQQTKEERGCKLRKKRLQTSKRGKPTRAHSLVKIMKLEAQTLPNQI